MRRSNMMTLLALVVLVGMIGVGSRICKETVQKSEAHDNSESLELKIEEEKKPDTAEVEKAEADSGNLNQKDSISQEEISMYDALFIGDSRTVGLSEYGGIEGADFFADVGMSVYNIEKSEIEIPHMGEISLKQLLSEKTYGKIYLMLGVNELGYDLEKTMEKYRDLLEEIMEKQPDATIFIQANLHVTRNRSDGDKVVNNRAINYFNKMVSEYADEEKILYMDANVIFDDSEGNLSADKTGDDTHLYAKYYEEWGDWIEDQTALLM